MKKLFSQITKFYRENERNVVDKSLGWYIVIYWVHSWVLSSTDLFLVNIIYIRKTISFSTTKLTFRRIFFRKCRTEILINTHTQDIFLSQTIPIHVYCIRFVFVEICNTLCNVIVELLFYFFVRFISVKIHRFPKETRNGNATL